MGYGKKIYDMATDRIAQRKLKAEKDADRRRAEIYKTFPRTKELEQQIATSGIRAARAVLNGGNVAENVRKLKVENLALQAELSGILISNGYSVRALEPYYSCPKCGDTGYCEENGKTVVCQCLKQMLITCACEELNKNAPLSLSTFESFNPEYYDKRVDSSVGISPYNQIQKIFSYCKNYAQNFNVNSKSLLMKGSTGLGKTHLSLAIANEVIKKGFGVIYATAPKLTQEFEKQFRSKGAEEYQITDMLIDCDLLIVDDLGTEFQTKYYTAQLYNTFNSRMLQDKPIIINTNLTMHELEKSYSQRFVSRVCGNAERLDFLGTDIRIRKK